MVFVDSVVVNVHRHSSLTTCCPNMSKLYKFRVVPQTGLMQSELTNILQAPEHFVSELLRVLVFSILIRNRRQYEACCL